MLPMPRQRSTESPVASRLRRLRGEPSDEPAAALAKLRWRYVALLALGASLVVAALVVAGGYRLSLPPQAMARQRLGNGLEVRLVGVTYDDQQTFSYTPPSGVLRRLAKAIGLRPGDPPVQASAGAPPGSVTIWLWVPRRGAAIAEGLQVTDEQRRLYVVDGPTRPLGWGAVAWGRRSLCWVSLKHFDRTAGQLLYSVPLTVGGAPAQFTVAGPAEAPRQMAAARRFPLVSGDEAADLRLWQLRRVSPAVMADWLSRERLPEPYEHYLLADVDVRERASAKQPGTWTLEVRSAVSDHGERLAAIKVHAGVIWLTNGRAPDDVAAVSLDLVARKWLRGRDNIVFRALDVPAKEGESKVWNRQADEPFPDGQFTAQLGERVSANVLKVTVEGRAPTGSQVLSLAWAEGLDQDGQALLPEGDRVADLQESRSGKEQVSWRWVTQVRVRPGTKTLALALRIAFKAAVARTMTTLTGAVQPALTPNGRAGLGLVLEPFGPADRRPRPFRVVEVVPNSRAATTPIAKGDEILAVDGLPPEMLTRALLRRQPKDKVLVRYRHGAQVVAVPVTLEAVNR